jgi:hypothetical protein
MRAARAATPAIVLPAITPALVLLLGDAVFDALAATAVELDEDLLATAMVWDVLRVVDWELEDADDVAEALEALLPVVLALEDADDAVEALEELLPVVLALEDVVVEGAADVGVKFTPV